MTQKELIIAWIKEHGYILPAKISGTIYHDTMFGSETSKRCREMRKEGKLQSKPFPENPKFEMFYLSENKFDTEVYSADYIKMKEQQYHNPKML